MISAYFPENQGTLMAQAMKNELKSIFPIVTGFIAAFLVAKVCRAVFDKKDPGATKVDAIKLFSFVAGSALGIYASSYFPLYTFTAKETLSVACMAIPMVLTSRILAANLGLPNDAPTKFSYGLGGAVLSLCGKFAHLPLSIWGGALATDLSGVDFTSNSKK